MGDDPRSWHSARRRLSWGVNRHIRGQQFPPCNVEALGRPALSHGHDHELMERGLSLIRGENSQSQEIVEKEK